MIVAVFSLGQFISSKLDVLKSGFQDWFKTQKKKTFQARLFGSGWLTISEFSKIFNSICTLDKASLERVAKFKELLDEQDEDKKMLLHVCYKTCW